MGGDVTLLRAVSPRRIPADRSGGRNADDLGAPRMSDTPAARKKLYIETVGCQMNLLDSELVVGKLRNEEYELTDDIAHADTLLSTPCAVRQHAEDKVYSALGRVRALKALKPELTIGVLGCMAQKDQGLIL